MKLSGTGLEWNCAEWKDYFEGYCLSLMKLWGGIICVEIIWGGIVGDGIVWDGVV